MFAAHASFSLPLDPVALSYVMALRGVRPRQPGDEFTYGQLNCGNGEYLLLLAASNPEGTFFGFDGDLEKLGAAADAAEKLGLKNVTFAQAHVGALKEAVAGGIISKGGFDYLMLNEADAAPRDKMAALAELAKALLRDNGVFAYRYRIYEQGDAQEVLFTSLSRHFLAEQAGNGEAAAAEWRALAHTYFVHHPADADAFDAALRGGRGMEWLRSRVPTETQTSKTIQVGEALRGGELTFLGSAVIANNYLELSAPETAHASLMARRTHPFYESFKDLAMGNTERIDLWAREPLQRLENMVPLFGGFTFGMVDAPERIARTQMVQGKSISFMGPLYDSILSLASVMPVTVGDLLAQDDLGGADQLAVLNTLQLLVACGVLQPMRASFTGGVSMEDPKLCNTYNASLADTVVDLQDYAFASTVIGRPLALPGMQTLVLQALHTGGLNGIAANLGVELLRLSSHPHLRPLGLDDSTRAMEESVRQIENSFNSSMVRWFSLGILHDSSQPA